MSRSYREFICVKCLKPFTANFSRTGKCYQCQTVERNTQTVKARSERRAAWRATHPKKSYYTVKNQRFALYDSRAKCPVCAGRFGDTDASLDICERHEGWIVTRCKVCGDVSFSDGLRGLCMAHDTADLPAWHGPTLYFGMEARS
jgi:hypothetical protein